MKLFNVFFIALLFSCSAISAPAWCQGSTTSGLIIDRDRPDRVAAPVQKAAQPRSPKLKQVEVDTPSVRPFLLREVQVENSYLKPGVVEAISKPYIDKTVDAGDLKKITEAISAVYENSDVALYTVTIPQQDFTNGVLRLRVLHGYIADVAIHVDGPQKVADRIKAYVAKLTTERPLRRSSLERALSLIRDIPGIDVKVDLQRTARPAGVRLAIDAEQKPFTVGLGINNRGTALLGRTQLVASADLYSLFRGGDNTHFTFATSPQLNRYQYYGVSHSQIINDEGTTLQGSLGYLRTRPSGAPAGDVKIAGLQMLHPLLRRYDRSLYLIIGMDALNSSNGLLGLTIADERTRVVRTALAYNKLGEDTSYSGSVNASQGLSGLGARIIDLRGARTNFQKLNVNLALGHKLLEKLVLRLSATGQYSHQRLPASEMFALGGDAYGRAFDAADVTGDYGYAGSAELAWSPDFIPKFFEGSEVYGFVDGGKAWTRVRGFPSVGYALASTGIGVRVPVTTKASVQLELAEPLKTPSYLSSSGPRLIFSIQSHF